MTPEQYAERLAICDACHLQRFGKCLICDCNLTAKAMMKSERCPKEPSYWPELKENR